MQGHHGYAHNLPSLGTTMWCSVIVKLVKCMSRCSQVMDLTSPSPGGKPSTQHARASKTELVEALAEKQALERHIEVCAGIQTLKCQHCETEYECPACTVSHMYACVRTSTAEIALLLRSQPVTSNCAVLIFLHSSSTS